MLCQTHAFRVAADDQETRGQSPTMWVRPMGLVMFTLTVMRVFAIFAISNSHLRELHHYQFLATGGILGNTVFFFISVFGITLGLLKTPEIMSSWYQRRLYRIYEPLFILTFIFIAIGYRHIGNVYDVIRLFAFPFEYWFVPAIAIFYILAYPFVKYGEKPVFIAAFIVIVVVYLILYIKFVDFEKWSVEDHIPVKSTYYFLVMLVGIYIARFHQSFVPSGRGFVRFSICTFIFLVFLFAVQRWRLFQIQAFAEFFALVWTMSFYLMLRNERNMEWIKSKTVVANGIRFVSTITLQMYLLGEFIFSQDILKAVIYPLNIMLFFVALIAAAWVLSQISILPLISERRERQSNA
jgi:hypothetical protein